jgi:hypothetical protein
MNEMQKMTANMLLLLLLLFYLVLSPSRSSRQRVSRGFISSSQLRAASRAQPWKFATKSPSW